MRPFVLAALAAGLALGPAARAAAQEDPRAVVARAVQAYGGADRLARLHCVRVTTQGTVQLAGAEAPFAAETTVQLPGRMRSVLHADLKGQAHTVTQVIDGNRVSVLVDDRAQPVKDVVAAELRELLYAEQIHTLTPLLRDPVYRLGLAGEGPVAGRPAVAVRVGSPEHKDVVLWFDREAGLLVKAERRTLDPETSREVLQEEYYSDYRESDGLQRPRKVVVFKDGKKFMEGEVVAIKYMDKVDASTFAQP
jgi:hypothetical protein